MDAWPAESRASEDGGQAYVSRKAFIAATVAAGCSSISQWPELAMTCPVTSLGTKRTPRSGSAAHSAGYKQLSVQDTLKLRVATSNEAAC
jgi:hypothetical protein